MGTSIDNQAATYVKLAKELSKKVKSENPAVILRYLKGDGSIIIERKFYKDTPVDEEKTAPERTTNLSGKIYSSIEDYLNDPTVQASFEQVKNQTDTSEYSVDVKAEQDKLIYIYTLKIEVQSGEQELMAQYIENNLASAESTFKNIANSLKAVVDVQNPCVVLRYQDNKGTLIVEKEIYAD